MPRAAAGPRLQLLGPDNKHGAKPRKGFFAYKWYILDRVNGKEIERSTGVEFHSSSLSGRELAEKALGDYLARKGLSEKPAGPAEPEAVRIADILTLYAEEHAAKHTAAPERIGYAIDALLAWFGDKPVSFITKQTRRDYAESRVVERRDSNTGELYVVGPAEGSTVRRELGVLDAAARHAVGEGRLRHYPQGMWLPAKNEARQRWLTRSDAAALLWAIHKRPRARYMLLFALTGLYMGARREAILSLQWAPNREGGYVNLDAPQPYIDFLPQGARQSNKRRAISPIPDRLVRFLRYARQKAQTPYVIEASRLETLPDGSRKRVMGRVQDVKTSFRRACLDAGLCDPVLDKRGRQTFDDEGNPIMEPNASPHTLKHTCITWLLQDGIDPWQVAGFVHTSLETITRTYGHHCPNRLQAAKDAPRGRGVVSQAPAAPANRRGPADVVRLRA